jgi:hypothetical protein
MAEVGAGELLVRAHGDGRRRRPRWLGPGDFKHSARTTSGLYRSYGVKGRSRMVGRTGEWTGRRVHRQRRGWRGRQRWRHNEGKVRGLNRGGLDRPDESMTAEMRPWHGGLGRRA